jgi:hypothetical protein
MALASQKVNTIGNPIINEVKYQYLKAIGKI